MEKDRRKALAQAYKQRKEIGGVYRIINRENNRYFLQFAADINAARNRFESFRQFDTCSIPPLQKDWKTYGKEAFYMEELELLEKREDQDAKAFRDDIMLLYAIWEEKLPPELRY